MPGPDWNDRLILIYFVYGLAFYSLGLALIVESGRSSEFGFARSMRLLAGFGFLHGTHEWIDMIGFIVNRLYDKPLPQWVIWLKLAVLTTSFISLIAFGEHLLARESIKRSPSWGITAALIMIYAISAIISPLIYALSETGWQQALDVFARYILSIPGSLLASLALWRQRQSFLRQQMIPFATYLNWGIVALVLYGIVGQSFPVASPVFPSMFVNSDRFIEIFGFPVQLLRAVLATILTISMLAVLRSLEFESQKRVEDLARHQIETERKQAEELAVLNEELRTIAAERQQLLEEVRKRDARRGELLLHITAAQEAERQRIARELHDDTGQVLTGLALGLRGTRVMMTSDPEGTAEKISDLEQMATAALTGLRHLINDLRPPQLDDMGLVSALRFMRERLTEFNNVPEIEVKTLGDSYKLPKDVETALFRIAQEGVTNSLKHANASHIKVELDFREAPKLTITDDGIGFDEEDVMDMPERTAWGLIGVHERANLINADLKISSSSQNGTVLEVQLREEVQ